MTRRDLLRTLTAALPFSLSGQVTDLARRGPSQRVAILGAGLAGLTCALELRKQGHEVTLLEAQTRPGGRVRTLREGFAPGLYAEAGPDSIPGAHDLTQHYAALAGVNLVSSATPGRRSFYHVRGRRILPDANTIWPFDLTEPERQLGQSGLNAKYTAAASDAIMAAGFSEHPVAALSRFDKLTPGQWLLGAGASPAAAEMLTLGFGREFGSAASFLLHGLSFRGGRPATRVEGGNDRLAAGLAAQVAIRYGAAATSVTQSDNDVAVRLSTGETLRADRLVCTLPCPAIGGIFAAARLSTAKTTAIREQFYSKTTKVFLQTSSRFWIRQSLSGSVTTDLPVERFIADPGAEPDARGALIAYPIADFAAQLEAMTETERVSAALQQGRTIFPELEQACEGGLSWSWGAQPWQKGAFALHRPGQIGFLESLAKREGRIHFAGEHTSRWTGWMQGAFESARRVVEEINAEEING